MAMKSISSPVVNNEAKNDEGFTFVPFEVPLAQKFTARVTEKLAGDVYLMRNTEQLAILYQVDFFLNFRYFHSKHFFRKFFG